MIKGQKKDIDKARKIIAIVMNILYIIIWALALLFCINKVIYQKDILEICFYTIMIIVFASKINLNLIYEYFLLCLILEY